MIAHIEAQGSLLTMKVLGFKSSRQGRGGGRGIIRAFSVASRRRLMRFLARLKVRKIRATFITLTFKEMVTHDKARKAFKRFTMRLRRAFRVVSAVWRLEYQPKRGAIHFHLICFNLPFWRQAELQKTWQACTKEEMSLADIRLVHGARSVMAYVSKYIAKIDSEPTSLDDVSYQHAEGESPPAARFWGWINKEGLPLGEVVTGLLTDRQTIKSLSSFVWALLKTGNPYNSLSFHLFCDNARWLCERAIEEGGCLYDEWSHTVKDHSEARATHSPYTERFSEPELSIKPVLAIGKMSRPSEASTIQPCTSDWLKRASLSFLAQIKQDFQNEGIIVSIVPQSKGHNYGPV